MQIAQNALNGAQFSIYFQLLSAATDRRLNRSSTKSQRFYSEDFAFDLIRDLNTAEVAAPNPRLTTLVGGAYTYA